MQFICDFVYVHLLDDLRQRARDERAIFATLRAGKAIKGDKVPEVEKAVEEFEGRLNAPLDQELRRDGVLRLVKTL